MYNGVRPPDLGGWKYYKDEFPPRTCELIIFTEEYAGIESKEIHVSLGFACDVADHMMDDLKSFGKEGLRFRFWQFLPLPPSLSEKMYYVHHDSPARITTIEGSIFETWAKHGR